MSNQDLSTGLAGVFEHIESHQDAFVDQLVDYVKRPSISAHGEGIAEVAEYISGLMTTLGIPANVVPTKGWPMVYGERQGPAGAPTILFYGHYDVQPPDPLEEWVSPPFEPTIRDDRLYARGVGDNKGQHLAQILGVASLLAVNGALPCNVKILLEGEEEVGSPRIADFVREQRDKIAADLVITSDGPVDESGRSRINFGARGVLSFELHAQGATRDLHSGNWGGVAPNPIWTLIHLLATMKNARGEVTIDGFYDNVLPLSPLEQDSLSQSPLDEETVRQTLGVKQFDQPLDRSYGERLTAWPTFTVNGFHGGYGGPGSKTVLPHEALVKCDIRLVEAQTADDIFARVEAHVKEHEPDVKVVRQGSMEPSKTPMESQYTEYARRGVEAGQGEEPLLVPSLGGSLPDYVFTKILGVPAFGVPYANADEANHAPNENLEIDRFIKGIKTGAAMVMSLGQMRSGDDPTDEMSHDKTGENR